ncbi:thioredoxin domain-containing protein [Arthrobacter sp. M2012083]|uniref:thioredoxin domain-containing protein n=1 Tax=Arthrobacter sp. M2012083 TaxID=1197706 RepID=UPI00037E835E|nr:thioredoxin domain-containing protein [Arthrobacter sp. M2012083]
MAAPRPAESGQPAETGGPNWPGANNALGSEPSAYLRQHADNPVFWRPFGDEAFAFAAERNVPVFLSIGYAACHWCHVMAHESFEDQKTADYLNANFVPVKVDREERPDVDSVYMAATQAISGEGGWPMSVFLTPDGLAFHAGTYFPPIPLPGRPSFRNVLEAVHEAWMERRDAVEQNARGLAANMANAHLAGVVRLDGPPEMLEASLLPEAVALLARSEDPDAGGFGSAPKFPPSAVLEFLIRHAAAPSDTALAARDMAARALAGMARSALRDQLDGGFARYSVTADWSVPHFEKMLYDNAQLLRVYAHWVRLGGNEVFPAGEAASVASRCADWLLGSLKLPNGALASSLDADTVVGGLHHEGATYVWTPGSLVDALGPADAEAVATMMNIGAEGTVSELGSPLHPARALTDAESRLWERVRPVLLASRNLRNQPARDHKVVAGWNGLAVAALAEAGAILDRADLVAAAEAVAEYLADVHWNSASQVLVRVSHDSRARGIGGLLEDYAFCADGLLALYAVTGTTRWYRFAKELILAAGSRFVENGQLADSAGESAQVFNAQGQKAALDPFDNATPSGAAGFAGALLSYAAYSGSHEHRLMAGNILGLLPPLATRAPRVAGWLLATAQAALAGPVEAAVAGPDSPLLRELHSALLKSPSPGLVVAAKLDDWQQDDGASPAGEAEVPLLLHRSGAPDGSAQVYLCRDMVCERPLSDVAAVQSRLASMAAGD